MLLKVQSTERNICSTRDSRENNLNNANLNSKLEELFILYLNSSISIKDVYHLN